MFSGLNGLWQSTTVVQQRRPHTFNHFFSLFFFFSLRWLPSTLPSDSPSSLPWPQIPPSRPLAELEDPWTMVITLPEAITVKQQWPAMLACSSVLQAGCLRSALWGACWRHRRQPESLSTGWQGRGRGQCGWVGELNETLMCFCRIQAVSIELYETCLETLRCNSKKIGSSRWEGMTKWQEELWIGGTASNVFCSMIWWSGFLFNTADLN